MKILHPFVTLLRRLVWAIPVLICLSLLMFMALKAVPGDVALIIAGERASPETIAEMRRVLHLDEAWYWQFLHYMKQVFIDFDLGRSLFHDAPVSWVLMTHLPATLELATLALFLALPIGLVTGVGAGLYKGRFIDGILSFFCMAGVSVPVFWTALILTSVFSLKLGLFPTGGRVSDEMVFELTGNPTHFFMLDALKLGLYQGRWDVFKSACQHAVLPSVTLSFIPMAQISKVTRGAFLQTWNSDFIRTARAKGLWGYGLIVKHGLRASAVPIVTIVCLQAGALFGGAVLTETMFSWPGLGRALYESISNRDFPMIQAGTLFVGFGFVCANALADVLYAFLDPRISAPGNSGNRGNAP